jgi:hypothetical protein
MARRFRLPINKLAAASRWYDREHKRAVRAANREAAQRLAARYEWCEVTIMSLMDVSSFRSLE